MTYSINYDNKDVVFLQEVWLKNDYDKLRKCTMARFHVSPFDKECGRLNKASNKFRDFKKGTKLSDIF